ncbi:MAG: M50 family metallopeptidase [Chloroflexota bacterium]
MSGAAAEPIRLQTMPDMMHAPEVPASGSLLWRLLKWLFYLGITGVTGIILGIIVIALPGPLMPGTSLPVAVIGVLLCLYVAVALHEVGHALGGKVAGYHLVFLIVGPLRLGREIGGWRLRLLPQNIFSFSGWAYSVPTQRDGWRWRRLLFILGGPLASLLLAFAVIGLRLIWQDAVISPSVALALHFMTFAAIAVLPFSIIPLVIRGIRNDALLFIDTLRIHGEQARRQQALAWLLAQAFQGKRSRDTDTAVLSEALYPADGSPEESLASIWGYYHELDRQRPYQAAAYLDRALSILQQEPQPALRSLCAMDAAFFEAWHGQRPAVAADWLKLVNLSQASHPTNAVEMELVYRRSRAAVLHANGEHEAAQKEAQQGLAILPRLVDQGGVKIEKEWLEQLLVGLPHDRRSGISDVKTAPPRLHHPSSS